MNKIPLTVTGAAMLQEELHRLKTIERPAVIEAIAEARAHGDLSENAEYDAAKEKQGFIEGRIQEVEGKLSHAQIIDPSSMDADGRCVFGSTIDLEDADSGQGVTYQIVGEDEADIKQGKISFASPLARAGAFIFFSGIALSLYAVWQWQQAGFGPLEPSAVFRIIIPAGFCISLGMQVMVFGFLLYSLRQLQQQKLR